MTDAALDPVATVRPQTPFHRVVSDFCESRLAVFGLFLVVISVIVPVWMLSVITQAVLEIALGRSELFSAGANPTTATVAEQVNMLVRQLPLIWGVNFMVAPLFLGLLLGAGAAIYRTLGDEKIA